MSATNDHDRDRMLRALALAARGEGRVSPNPLVGCVIERNGRIIGEGWHERYGGPHAEAHAVRRAGAKAIGSTVYVTLEPCVHTAKTPPCADVLIAAGVSRVVVGMKDPYRLVAGRGIRKLRAAGIRVDVGVAQEECAERNVFFVRHVTSGMPYVALKLAMTIDGRIAERAGKRTHITGSESEKAVHAMRAKYDAVLIGAGTVRADDPELTVRAIRGRNPYRIILDADLSLPPTSRVYSDEFSHLTIACASTGLDSAGWRRSRRLAERGVSTVVAPTLRGMIDLRTLLAMFGRLGLASILVEGGSRVASSLLRQNLVDRLELFIAPRIFGGGLPAFTDDPAIARSFSLVGLDPCGGDVRIRYLR